MTIVTTTGLRMNKETHVVCNFDCFFENGLFKVTGSHVRFKCGNTSKTVQDGVVKLTRPTDH